MARHASTRITKLALLVKAASEQPRWRKGETVPMALADATGCRLPSIYRWIDGSRRLKGDNAERVASYFGVSVDDVIGYADEVEEDAA